MNASWTGRWLAGGLLLLHMCLLHACLRPQELLSRYTKLTVAALHQDANELYLRVTFCDEIPQRTLSRERKIQIPLGVENFYLPALPAGRVELLVTALHVASAATSQADTRRILAHQRVVLSYPGDRQPLPELSLRAGALPAPYQPCVVPPPDSKTPPPTPPALQAPLEISTGLSLPQGQAPTIPSPQAPAPLPAWRDRLVARTPIHTLYPTWTLATQGHMAILPNTSENFSTDAMSLLDVRANALQREIPTFDDCKPRGVDIQGDVCAVVCWGQDRLMLFSTNSWKTLGPKQGVAVGKQPIAVSLHGPLALVVNQASHDISLVQLDQLDKPAQTFSLQGTKPLGIVANNGEFFVLHHSAQRPTHGQVSSFILNQKRELLPGPSFAVGQAPQEIAANQRYILVTHPTQHTLTLRKRANGQVFTLPMPGAPQAVAILSHTAFVSDASQPRMYVVDLRKHRVLRTIPLQAIAHKIAITGEWLLLSSRFASFVMRYQLTTRPGLLHLRMGTATSQLNVAGALIMSQDPLSQTLWSINLPNLFAVRAPLTPKISAIPFSSASWSRATSSFLIHTSADGKSLHLRSTQQPALETIEALTFKLPVSSGRLHNNLLYLTHQSDDPNTFSPPFLTRLDLAPLQQNKPWDAITIPLPFGQQNIQASDLIAWKEFLLLADPKNFNLYLLKTTDKTQQSLAHQDTLTLPARPQKVAISGEFLAVTLDDYNPHTLQSSLVLVHLPSWRDFGHDKAPQHRVYFHGRLHNLLTHKQHLLLLDQDNDQILFFDPKSRSLRTKIDVACRPTDLRLWQKTPSETWAVLSHPCSSSLSLTPLP